MSALQLVCLRLGVLTTAKVKSGVLAALEGALRVMPPTAAAAGLVRESTGPCSQATPATEPAAPGEPSNAGQTVAVAAGAPNAEAPSPRCPPASPPHSPALARTPRRTFVWSPINQAQNWLAVASCPPGHAPPAWTCAPSSQNSSQAPAPAEGVPASPLPMQWGLKRQSAVLDPRTQPLRPPLPLRLTPSDEVSELSAGAGVEATEGAGPLLPPPTHSRSLSPATLFSQRRTGPPLPRSFRLTDFADRKKIGCGAQAAVFRAVYRGEGPHPEPGTAVCLKEFADLQAGRRELAALEGLAPHPNVIRCFGSFEAKKGLYLILELCDYDLRRVVSAKDRERDRAYRTAAQRLVLMRGVAEALDHLHAHDVLHCDIKLENVMVGFDGRPRLCDFGLAQPFRDQGARECIGTVFSMAPEVVVTGSPYGEKYSVWQFGIVLAQVMWSTADDLFEQGHQWPMRAIQELQYRLPPEDPTLAEDGQLRELLRHRILVHEKERMTIGELLQHPLFARNAAPSH